MHMDIFNDDAFAAVTMTEALEDYEFKPGLVSSMNLFEDIPTSTEMVSIERRGNTLAIIPTSERGAPPVEGKRDRSNFRAFKATRIAKGHTIQASEIQNVRAFGRESELETMIGYVARYEKRLIDDVEVTWENMQLGALQGKLLDHDGSVLVDWFLEWGITPAAEIDFDLDNEATNVELKCRGVIRAMRAKAKGAWRPGTKVVSLCGDGFFDKLTTHKSVTEKYLGYAAATQLLRGFGAATQSAIGAGSYATFEVGGILFINYESADTFDSAKKAAGTAKGMEGLGIETEKAKFFPIGAPGVYQQAFAPGEGWAFANTIGRPLYAMTIRDKDRDFWVRPEVYSYPLYICTRPEMLLTAKAQ